jgi:hypothetical protein
MYLEMRPPAHDYDDTLAMTVAELVERSETWRKQRGNLARLVGVGEDRLDEYRLVARSWPFWNRIDGVPYGAYRELAGVGNRVEVLDRLLAEGGGKVTVGAAKRAARVVAPG